MRSSRGSFLLLLLAALLLLPAALPASTLVRQMSPAELGRQAAVVVRGEVTGVRSYWNDQHTKIFTEVLVQADEAYKGGGTGSLRLVQLGGTVDNVRVTVHGALTWSPGEEVVLFLEPGQDDALQVAGFSQGKFQVERDAATGRVYVTRAALEGIASAAEPGRAATAARLARIPLERFLTEALGKLPAVER